MKCVYIITRRRENLKETEGTCHICLENVQAQVIMEAIFLPPPTPHKYGKPPQSALLSLNGRLQSQRQFYLLNSIPFAWHDPMHTLTHTHTSYHLHSYELNPFFLTHTPVYKRPHSRTLLPYKGQANSPTAPDQRPLHKEQPPTWMNQGRPL